jgi:hypothetical protein
VKRLRQLSDKVKLLLISKQELGAAIDAAKHGVRDQSDPRP